jgi:membrane-associated protein
VVTPFLPGDSLLFAAGAFAAAGAFDVVWLYAALAVAAIAGDSVNYSIGKAVGEKIFRQNAKILKKEYLDKTHRFFEKYGNKAIVLARFVPLMRTFVPFVAGVGKMSYSRFIVYNITGGLIWVTIFVLGGYFFGNIPIVKKNFILVIMAIVTLSLVPAVMEFLKHIPRRRPGTESG